MKKIILCLCMCGLLFSCDTNEPVRNYSSFEEIIVNNDLAALKKVALTEEAMLFKDSYKDNLLSIAIMENKTELAQFLIESGYDVANVNKMGITPLMLAALYGNKTIVKELLTRECGLELESREGLTACGYAASHNHNAVLQMLLTAGGNPNHKTIDGMTILMTSAASGKIDIMKTLLKNGAKINQKDSNGESALMYAVRARQPKSVAFLIKQGASIKLPNNDGDNALTIAKIIEDKKIISLLQK